MDWLLTFLAGVSAIIAVLVIMNEVFRKEDARKRQEERDFKNKIIDLYAEGVKYRNRLMNYDEFFNSHNENLRMKDWEERIELLCFNRVRLFYLNRFLTLNTFHTDVMEGTTNTYTEQLNWQRMWSAKLERFDDILLNLEDRL